MSCSPDTLIRRIAIPLARVDPANAGTTADVVLWMTNPSALLSAMLALVLQPDRGSEAMRFGTSSVWQIYPALPVTGGGADILAPQALAPVFSAARSLPDGYVITDPTKLVKVVATIAAHGSGLRGVIYAVATWEGKDACLSPALRAALLAGCSLVGDGAGVRALSGVAGE